MKAPGRLAGSNVTLTVVFSPGRIGRLVNWGTVQPQVVTTSRITTGVLPRFSPVNVWLTRPSVSRIVPKSQVSGVKTSCACAAVAKAQRAKSVRRICRRAVMVLIGVYDAKVHFLRKNRAIILRE